MDDIEALLARRDKALGSGVSTFYRRPLHIVRGEGTYLFDADGRRYVDMYNNVPCVGHGNPRVADAMARAQSTLNTHSRYLHEGIIEFAERLTALHGERIECAVFSCSGTEAIEVALRMARIATGRRGIICTNATYHGNSELVGGLTDLAHRPAPVDVRAIPFPEMYRPLETGLSEGRLCEAYLARLAQAIDSLEASGHGVAAFIVCSILANEGLPDIPAGFMPRAADMVRKAGGLVISDEVQAGYCRTGRWWGYEVTGFAPDIVVTGKPMGNGLPLSATAASKALVDTFRARTRHFNTFAQSPLQAAVGMAVLDEIESRNLRENAASVGAWLTGEMKKRVGRWPSLGDVRGVGLFIGAEMITDPASRTPDAARAADIAERLKDKGFLTAAAGAFNNSVKVRPPLVYGQDDAAAFLAAFDAAMDEAHQKGADG
jgi:4-aminobutyrate aminotransferase-like enzyme